MCGNDNGSLRKCSFCLVCIIYGKAFSILNNLKVSVRPGGSVVVKALRY